MFNRIVIGCVHRPYYYCINIIIEEKGMIGELILDGTTYYQLIKKLCGGNVQGCMDIDKHMYIYTVSMHLILLRV